MNKEDLITKLKAIYVNDWEYSLNGNLAPNTIILYPNYHKWEVFYLDERGNGNVQKNFSTESEALEYIYQLFLNQYNSRLLI